MARVRVDIRKYTPEQQATMSELIVATGGVEKFEAEFELVDVDGDILVSMTDERKAWEHRENGLLVKKDGSTES